jgi:hypothetical protein
VDDLIAAGRGEKKRKSKEEKKKAGTGRPAFPRVKLGQQEEESDEMFFRRNLGKSTVAAPPATPRRTRLAALKEKRIEAKAEARRLEAEEDMRREAADLAKGKAVAAATFGKLAKEAFGEPSMDSHSVPQQQPEGGLAETLNLSGEKSGDKQWANDSDRVAEGMVWEESVEERDSLVSSIGQSEIIAHVGTTQQTGADPISTFGTTASTTASTYPSEVYRVDVAMEEDNSDADSVTTVVRQKTPQRQLTDPTSTQTRADPVSTLGTTAAGEYPSTAGTALGATPP